MLLLLMTNTLSFIRDFICAIKNILYTFGRLSKAYFYRSFQALLFGYSGFLAGLGKNCFFFFEKPKKQGFLV